MKRQRAWQFVGLTAIFLSAAGVGRAAVQGREGVYWLGTGKWQLCPDGDSVYLVESHWDRSDWYRGDKSLRWVVSTPTIKASSGKFLAGDPAGRNPTVHLVATPRRASARWVFEFVSRLEPGPSKEERGRFREGPSGFTFRVKKAAGPFKDWYLAAGEPAPGPNTAKGEKTVRRPLKLVRSVKDATVFSYIEDNYFVDHK
jgi:hypothetical protein